MKEEAEKYDDVELVMVDGKSDMNAQTAQLENFIAQKVDAIVMVPIEKEAAVPIVETIHDSKIPLISVNRQLANQELAVSYAGSNAIESGEIEMKAMAEALGGKGNIVILEGAYGAEAALERRKGFDNILKEYPDIKIVAENTANWKRDEAMALMENWLQSDLGGIDGIVAANDEMAIGALMAVEDAGMLDKIKISGIDATPEALDYLEEGKLAITVFQDAKGQGAKAVELAIKAAHGEKIESEAMIPYELVSKDKVDEYRKKYE
jgi:inositol transport system substrate-binding protein